jgi:hypothetical protein
MKSRLEKFKRIDTIFSQKVHLTINGDNNHKTWCGAVATILLLSVISGYALNGWVYVAAKDVISLSKEERYTPD